jgi:cell division protein FtsI (penicillin-binding protein 3)
MSFNMSEWYHNQERGKVRSTPEQQIPPAPRRAWRFAVTKAFFIAAFLIIAARLVQIQVVESPKYKAIAQRQYEAKVVLPATRGSIFDRNGNVLASNTLYVSFAADPKNAMPYISVVANEFSGVFGKSAKGYRERLLKEKRFVWMERHISPEIAERLDITKLPGVVKLDEPKRLYHYPGIAGALMGFTDLDNRGLSGIELGFERYLRGTDGYVILQRDGRGEMRPSADYLRVEPLKGNNIFLTIDLAYQFIAEEKLKLGVGQTGADGGLVIMMRPETGEILAIAQYPRLDQTDVGEENLQHQKLRAVTDMFEPGSVFKIVTASAALEHDLVSPGQRFYAEHGMYTVELPRGKVRVIKDTHEHDMLTFQEAMEVSSNIVMAKISNLIGNARFYEQARAFGFGTETGVDYPGETRGELKRPTHWSGTTLNTMSYGYEVGATPLQLALAYCAVANNGWLMRPLLVRKVVSPTGEVLAERLPERIRQAVSPRTAAMLKAFFEGAVERGTGKPAKLEGVRICGKTGTSRKYIEGKYETGSYTASFVGFFPADQPEVLGLVMLDNPRSGGYTGGATAAPIFREIVRQIITTGRTIVEPKPSSPIVRTTAREVIVPDLTNLQHDVAEELLKNRGLTSDVYGEGFVIRQAPSAGTSVAPGSRITLVLNGQMWEPSDDEIIVPELKGMSVRRAVNRLAIDNLSATVRGSGVVVSQVPPAGETVSAGASILLVCEPGRMAVRDDNP